MKKKDDKNKYISLAPRVGERGEYKEYYNALDFALKDKSIRNIAITGPYGAGKSSVIDSYFNNHKEIKCIRISLAYFNFSRLQNNGKTYKDENGINETKVDTNTTLDKDLTENDIEAEVLKNLFYSVDGKKLKSNRFLTVKSKNGIKDYFLQGIFVFSIIAVVLLTKLFFTIIDKILFNANDTKHILELTYEISKFYLTKLLLFCFIILIIFIVGTVKNFDKLLPYIKSMIFRNTKIDISNKSIINQYLHEIMNFMIEVEESVFIFEDLDRYENYNIFEKLRNLCILINSNEIIKKKFEYEYNVKCIKFIYAIKDDFVFDNNENMSKPDDLSEERTKFFDFIIPIIPKITKNNVKDELVKYKRRLQLNDITDDYISVIGTYLTNLRSVNNIFNEFQVYKKSISGSDENFDNMQLLTLMIFKNLHPKEFSEYQKNGILEKVMNDVKNAKYTLLMNSKRAQESLEPIIVNDPRGINALNVQSQKIYSDAKKYIDLLENKKIGIYDDDKIKEIFKQCGNNKFLVAAIRYGYLNDNVGYYINYYYPDFIDNHDNEFLKNMRAGNDLGAEYKLHNVERMYNTLQEADFSTRLIVNYDLIKYCLCEKCNDNKTKGLCDIIIANEMLIFDIINYFESSDGSKVISSLITKCNELDNEYFISLMLYNKIEDNFKQIILDKILLYLNEENISKMDENQVLSDFANGDIDEIYKKDDKLQELYVNRLNIKCESIIYDKSNANQGRFVNKLMKEKTKNEECFAYKDLLKVYYSYKNMINDDFENDNLSFIYSTGENNVINNIKAFSDEYVEKCLLNTNIESITIDNNMVELLYSLENKDNVINIIKGLKGKIEIQSFDYIGKIKVDAENNDEKIESYNERKKLIYAELLNNVNINLTMNDLYKYFSDLGWGQPLTNYISNNLDELLNYNIEAKNVDDNVLRFYKNMILYCKLIDNIVKLLGNNTINLQYTELASLPPKLVEKLLQGNHIKYDVNCLVTLYNNRLNGIEWYIYYNVDDFINSNQLSLLSEDLLIKIIDIFNHNSKEQIDKVNTNILFTNICKLIDNKYTTNPNFDPDGVISTFIINSNYVFSYNILNRVFLNKDMEVKFEILYNKLDYISKENIVAIIKSNNGPFYSFLNGANNIYTVDKENTQKSFNKVKKIVNFIVKKQLAEKIETQNTNVIAFKLL